MECPAEPTQVPYTGHSDTGSYKGFTPRNESLKNCIYSNTVGYSERTQQIEGIIGKINDILPSLFTENHMESINLKIIKLEKKCRGK
jgi:hypothetical protein